MNHSYKKSRWNLIWLGLLATFHWTAGATAQREYQHQILDKYVADFDRFGTAMALNQDWLFVGAPDSDSGAPNAGKVEYYFYREDQEKWKHGDYLFNPFVHSGDRFGVSLAMGEDFVAIGAPGAAPQGLNTGAVVIADWNPLTGKWELGQILRPTDGELGDQFGLTVAAAGNRIVVGAPFHDHSSSDSGAAYVFIREPISNHWIQEAKLTPTGGHAFDHFGSAVSLSQTESEYVALIGSRGDDALGFEAGAAYAFHLDPQISTWMEQSKLVAPDGAAMDLFGASLSVCGNRALIGARFDDDLGMNSGAAYVFEYEESSQHWNFEVKLRASDGQAHDWFGHSVFLSEELALIGAPRVDAWGEDSGAAYAYWPHGNSDLWGEERRFLPYFGYKYDQFGATVSAWKNRVMVAAPYYYMGISEAGIAFLYQPFFHSSASKVSAAQGGLIRFDLDFPKVMAGQSYALLASATGNENTLLGESLLVPLTGDPLFWNTVAGVYPGGLLHQRGQLDLNGDAFLFMQIPAGTIQHLAGRPFWFAVVAYQESGQSQTPTMGSNSVPIYLE
ncbi:MAG: hypothetical protein DWQ01_10725 [Planctomycetota bacterium]|nr:MAG: hypothetical protein DWQ01_10725 [Planctomycetota bacterium]